MDSFKFILTFLLVAIINLVFLYFRSRKTHKEPSMHLRIDSEQDETGTEREIPPASDSDKAGKGEQVKILEPSTAFIPIHESTSCAPHDPDTHPPSLTPSCAPTPIPPTIVSYHEIIAAVTRCVHV
jgi:hypothetical protein